MQDQGLTFQGQGLILPRPRPLNLALRPRPNITGLFSYYVLCLVFRFLLLYTVPPKNETRIILNILCSCKSSKSIAMKFSMCDILMIIQRTRGFSTTMRYINRHYLSIYFSYYALRNMVPSVSRTQLQLVNAMFCFFCVPYFF